MDEFTLIRRLLQHRITDPVDPRVEVDAGDDAAVLRGRKGMSTVVTCDTMVETIHFLPNTMDPFSIGWKCLTSNISDIAAMGGIPSYTFVSLAVADHWKPSALESLYQGMKALAEHYGVRLIGGDTVRSPHHLVVTLTLMGEVEEGRALLRSSAQPGDIFFVTGPLGASAAGLHLLLQSDQDGLSGDYPGLIEAHQRPHPQVDAGRWLLTSEARIALNDISDGLAQEAYDIAAASGVTVVLDGARLPLDDSIRSYAREVTHDPVDWALYGGEDFQLAGTVSRREWERVCRGAQDRGIRLIPVGWVEEGKPRVDYVDGEERRELTRRGFNHFRKG
ncbi:thiamine-phosphate kinase [Desmospora profundinema]|uniref:Thiamine-monophosphate kinase n=1 Tax=Desmospora profundinema TaxID=1571184 RepID=A0ABU1ISW5_9BACL|nr:thiamine-phosphate kinase [Desmospora profundinema]MDR6227538.1 thiamine-monophosphate kinase [Desmospora profundinema]